ncbi:MAG: hypothetical protein V3V01_10895 [Acidimicrobiales bacterium]
MGKASSSKKVARAARAGRTATSTERRDLGFPSAMVVVVILGVLLVVYARSTRDASANSPSLRDHWHSAYAVWDCEQESFENQFTSDYDPRGIHSHSDGLLHIHPFSSSVTGEDANLGVFFEAMRVDLDPGDGVLTLPDGSELVEGTQCDGQPAVLQVARFDASNIDAGPTEVIVGDIDKVRFLSNREAITIALAPVGAEIPPPPPDRLAALDAASPDRGVPNTIIPTPLGADSDDAPADGHGG